MIKEILLMFILQKALTLSLSAVEQNIKVYLNDIIIEFYFSFIHVDGNISILIITAGSVSAVAIIGITICCVAW